MLVSKQRDKISLFRHELSSWRNFVVLHFVEPTICVFSKKKRQFKMFETTVEIFSLVFLGFFFFRFLFQCLVQVSSRKPNSNRSNHKMS